MMLRIPWIEHDQILERKETITSPIISIRKGELKLLGHIKRKMDLVNLTVTVKRLQRKKSDHLHNAHV